MIILPSSTPVKGFLHETAYVSFLKSWFPISAYLGFLGDDTLERAKGQVSNNSFSVEWAKYVGKNPIFCGKAHEFHDHILTTNCSNHGNPLCGHISDSSTFHTICVGSYVASALSGEKIDPSRLIKPPEHLDRQTALITMYTPQVVQRYIQPQIRIREIGIWRKMEQQRDKIDKILRTHSYL